MVVVSDTSPITTLLKAGMEGLLSNLFGNVIVPNAVSHELLAFHSQLPNFLSSRALGAGDRTLPETSSLGRGEAEAITLARKINADLLLTDDATARAVAVGLKIQCTGLLGLLIWGKRRGHVSSVRTAIETLEKKGGLYLSDAVKAEALKLAGEIQ